MSSDITTRCEYRHHGDYGPEDSPACIFIRSKCPRCIDSKTILFFICYECLSTPKDFNVFCGKCDLTMSPESSWAPVFEW